MKRTSHCAAALLLGASASWLAFAGAAAQGFVPVTDATLANPAPGDWLMLNRTYDE